MPNSKQDETIMWADSISFVINLFIDMWKFCQIDVLKYYILSMHEFHFEVLISKEMRDFNCNNDSVKQSEMLRCHYKLEINQYIKIKNQIRIMIWAAFTTSERHN